MIRSYGEYILLDNGSDFILGMFCTLSKLNRSVILREETRGRTNTWNWKKCF